MSRDNPDRLQNDGWVSGVLLLPDGQRLISLQSGSERAALWNLESGKRRFLPETPSSLPISSFSASQQFLAIAQGNMVFLRRHDDWTLSDQQLQSDSTAAITSLKFSPDGRLLAGGNADGQVMIWEVSSGTCKLEKSVHTAEVTDLSFEPCGNRLASSSRDGTCKLWDSNGNHVSKVNESIEGIMTVEFSPDGSMLACGGYENKIELWNVSDQFNQQADYTLEGHLDGILAMKFFEDGRTLMTTSGDNTVRIWDIELEQQRIQFPSHSSSVGCASLSSDDLLLVSGDRDGNIRIWRAASEEEVEATDWWRGNSNENQ